MKIQIVDIFWDRIYLNILFEGINLEEKNIYLKSELNEYKLEITKIEDEKYKSQINITNIKNGMMLSNANYRFIVKEDNKEEYIEITNQLGYKLEQLDKIYKYGKDFFAYTISFVVEDTENGEIICVLKSRYMKKNKKYKKIQVGEVKNKIRKISIMLAKNIFKQIYKIFSFIHPNKEKNILLMSETRAPISGNLKALDDRIKERGIDKQYKINYSFFKTLELGKLTVILKWLKLIWTISKQELIFIDDYTPIFKFINLDKKTKLIQLWHAGVGFKSVGYARFGFSGPEPYNSCHRKYDYAIVGAESLIPVYQEVFGIDKEKILPYGLPRLDNFLDENNINKVKNKLYSEFEILKNKKVILFAPTFRGKGQKEAYYPYQKIELDKIYDLCMKENYVFVIKMHPFVRKKIDIPEEYQNCIIDLSDYNDINEIFYVTDILITDYSSNIYDFSLLNKPILFYTFDLDFYQLINKVHRPIREYAPGKICTKFEEIIEAISKKDFEIEKLNKFREENFSKKNKKSTDLIIDNIILKNKEND